MLSLATDATSGSTFNVTSRPTLSPANLPSISAPTTSPSSALAVAPARLGRSVSLPPICLHHESMCLHHRRRRQQRRVDRRRRHLRRRSLHHRDPRPRRGRLRGARCVVLHLLSSVSFTDPSNSLPLAPLLLLPNQPRQMAPLRLALPPPLLL